MQYFCDVLGFQGRAPLILRGTSLSDVCTLDHWEKCSHKPSFGVRVETSGKERCLSLVRACRLLKSGYFTLASTAVFLSEHLPRLGIRTPDLPALSSKVLSIRPSRWYAGSSLYFLYVDQKCLVPFEKVAFFLVKKEMKACELFSIFCCKILFCSEKV